MQTISFSNYSFKKLEKMTLDKSITNTEGKLFIIPEKLKWNTLPKALKIFYNTEGEIFSNKLFTINSLINKKEDINIDELVFPEKLAIVGSQICGYAMPFIKNINLGLLLNNPNIPVNEKIDYLKQIGQILEKMKIVRNKTKINDFFLGDIYENNFILNLATNRINAVDIDSCKINDNKPSYSKYLSTLYKLLNNLPKKYIKAENWPTEDVSLIIPNENSDLFCYNIIILNYLLQGQISRLSLEEFYVYLNYLRQIGLPYRLVDKFDNLYQYKDNENPMEELDYITSTVLEKSGYDVFYHKVLDKNL